MSNKKTCMLVGGILLLLFVMTTVTLEKRVHQSAYYARGFAAGYDAGQMTERLAFLIDTIPYPVRDEYITGYMDGVHSKKEEKANAISS